MTPQERIIRGKEADQLRSNPILVEALTAIEDDLVSDWRTSKPEDSATRENAFAQLQALNRLKEKIESFVNDGTLANLRANTL